MDVAGVAAEGAIIGGAAGLTCGASLTLGATMAWMGTAGFVGSGVEDIITTGEVDYFDAAVEGTGTALTSGIFQMAGSLIKTPPQLIDDAAIAATNRGTSNTVANLGADDTKYVNLYHGTSKEAATAIREGGIDLSKSRANLDFGKGFYTTRNETQAIDWVNNRYPGGEVLKFKMPVSELGNMNGLKFSNATSSWTRFIRHNRLGGRLHNFDYVEGPMLLNRPKNFLQGQPPISGGNQISFHTKNAVEPLMKYLQK